MFLPDWGDAEEDRWHGRVCPATVYGRCAHREYVYVWRPGLQVSCTLLKKKILHYKDTMKKFSFLAGTYRQEVADGLVCL